MTAPSAFTDPAWIAREARRQALEEAARICDEVKYHPMHYSATDAARAIRALINAIDKEEK